MKTNSLQSALDKIKQDTGVLDNKSERNTQPNDTLKNKKKTTVLIGSHFNPNILKQLRILAAEEDKTHHTLLQEALDLLFLKYGKKQISDINK